MVAVDVSEAGLGLVSRLSRPAAFNAPHVRSIAGFHSRTFEQRASTAPFEPRRRSASPP